MLDHLLSQKSIAVIAGRKDELMIKLNAKESDGKEKKLNSMLHSFARKVPWRVSLADLTPLTLANITTNMAKSRGYELSSSQENVDPMVAIVMDKYDIETITQRNAYLGVDMLEEAISRKNEQEQRNSQKQTMILTPVHFRIERRWTLLLPI